MSQLVVKQIRSTIGTPWTQRLVVKGLGLHGVEGIDGAGTTTQTTILAERMRARGLPAIATREPTGGPVGSLLRQALTHRLVVPGAHGSHPPSWKVMALLFAADRLDHLEAEVLPNIADGVTVISDRYDLSSLAYQTATANQEDGDVVAWIRQLNSHARRPDLTIVVDVSASAAAKRRAARGGAIELFEHDELQRKLAAAYRGAEQLVPGDRLVHVDGEAPAEVVAETIDAAVRAFRNDPKT